MSCSISGVTRSPAKLIMVREGDPEADRDGRAVAAGEDRTPLVHLPVGRLHREHHETTADYDGDTFDLMGYCRPRWISDYNYAAIDEVVQRVSPLAPLDSRGQSRPRCGREDAAKLAAAVSLAEPENEPAAVFAVHTIARGTDVERARAFVAVFAARAPGSRAANAAAQALRDWTPASE